WEWRGGPFALLKRLIITLVVATISFVVTAWLSPRMTVDRALDAAVAVILMALFNAAIRPVVLALAARVSLVLVGILVLVLQIVAFVIVAQWAPGVHVDGFGTALFASFIYAIINTILTAILGVDSGDSYYALLVQRLLVKRSQGHSDKPGLVILQIDGLAHPILAGRMRAGSVNTMASWVRDGSHKLSRWEAILPSMTSGSQAGILHGNNDGIPAFRWYEKEAGRIMVANHPEDAAIVATRISNGEGLLSNNGASVGNLFSGDAVRSYITMATIKDKGQGLGKSQTFFSFFASPYNYLHTLVRSVGEIIKEYIQSRRQVRAGIVPVMHRGMPYPIARAATNVALRDLSTSLVIEEMYRGAPVIYVDYTDYDEIAHHSGPERSETFDALDGVDAAIATLEKAAAAAPRPYRFVIVSDHGQSLGSTFLQRYGKTLADVIHELMGGKAKVEEAVARVEEWGQTNAFLSELTSTRGVTGRLARTALRSQTADGVVELGPDEGAAGTPDGTGAPEERPDLIAIASGNLGLVYFPRLPGRVTLEQLTAAYPGLVDALAAHAGVGAILIASEAHGSLVIGHGGIHYLEEGRVEGVDPVGQFGGRARQAFLRLDGMSHVPDL
ncbi:MAG TPA: phage holin family protein, partial [Candidatus Deferrimicrobium sp.]|nr:phage holin family protein [Candidatus Deferrimicrobium sp.]